MTTYGRVYYQNFLGSFGFIIVIIASQEYNTLDVSMLDPKAIGIVTLTCFLGMGMSTFSYRLRAMVSSTYMAVIGNMCKVITVIINFFIWDKHANGYGLAALGLCLVCAYFYKQAPRREDVQQDHIAVPTEEKADAYTDDDDVEDPAENTDSS